MQTDPRGPVATRACVSLLAKGGPSRLAAGLLNGWERNDHSTVTPLVVPDDIATVTARYPRKRLGPVSPNPEYGLGPDTAHDRAILACSRAVGLCPFVRDDGRCTRMRRDSGAGLTERLVLSQAVLSATNVYSTCSGSNRGLPRLARLRFVAGWAAFPAFSAF